VERKSKIKDKKSKLQVKKQKFSALASRGSQRHGGLVLLLKNLTKNIVYANFIA